MARYTAVFELDKDVTEDWCVDFHQRVMVLRVFQNAQELPFMKAYDILLDDQRTVLEITVPLFKGDYVRVEYVTTEEGV